MRAVAATRHGWYKAIEVSEHTVDKAIHEYQQELRGQQAIDNWPRRYFEFVYDNVRFWSRYLLRDDNSAEYFVSVPTQLPSSVAYARCTRQRLARHCGSSYWAWNCEQVRLLLSQNQTSPYDSLSVVV